MAGGLVALLDDIAALAKLAAASVDDVGMAAGRATARGAGVVVDDTAVTPRYVEGFSPGRGLPGIRRIAMGSIRNKLLFITPAALLLSQFAPCALSPLLMVAGTYLRYEGAENGWERRLRGAARAAGGSGAKAAELLGMPARTFNAKMEKWDVAIAPTRGRRSGRSNPDVE